MPDKIIETKDVTKTVISGKNEIVWEDIKRWANNIFIFSSGSIIIFLVALQTGATIQTALLALYGALINAVIDLVRKYQQEIKYVPVIK